MIQHVTDYMRETPAQVHPLQHNSSLHLLCVSDCLQILFCRFVCLQFSCSVFD